MHMADPLISAPVGAAMWAVSSGLIAHSARRLKQELDERRVPLMGLLGAFIFSAQMINFAIPGTGSSGHIGGGMILAILLGPHAAFLTIASVLGVQALFFADGGLLALGCNIFNMGFFPCFIAYPFIYRKIVGGSPTKSRILYASLISAVLGLQMGALGVVLETVFSRIAALPFATFILLMQPIHLAIGLVEGFITAAVVTFIWKARPEIIEAAASSRAIGALSLRRVLLGLLAATILTAGVLSWFASSRPDGLEWAMFRTAGKGELAKPEKGLAASLGHVQEKAAVLPDYGFKRSADAKPGASVVKPGASVAGLVGAALVLTLVGALGLIVRRRGTTS